ncbi:MAG: MalY/PatB family protein [Candidatus Promineifilaceae bacterium]|jgi:cystathionine beta-lyase
MTYSFDEEIDRFETQCLKWEFEKIEDQMVPSDRAHAKYGDDRLLPLWVADMDFKSPPQVIKALEERASHGVFGYCVADDDYFEAVEEWMARRYGWHVDRDWITITPGVVTALYILIQAFTGPGDKILIQPPVYHPFYSAIEDNGRVVVRNPLKRLNGRYEMDFDDLAEKTADPAVKLAVLCSPHNPVGRVWTAEELRRFGEICQANDVLVISDEIHADLVLSGHSFTSFATVDEAFAANSIICTAPSKTFNLAGLRLSNIIARNEDQRKQFQDKFNSLGHLGPNIFGLVAAETAYRSGEEWLAEVLSYIEGNYNFLRTYLAEHLPQLALTPLEGTYLAWIDFSALGLDPAARTAFLMEEAKVWLNPGEIFGAEGADFERVNIACPRSLLAEALGRIKTAVDSLD